MMKSLPALTLIVLLASALLAACAPSASLSGGSWQLAELNGQPLPGNVTITLVFADQDANGSGGCNSYGGSYEQKKSDLTFGDMASTLMYCEETSAYEAAYFAALENVRSYELTGAQLTLRDAQGSPLLVFSPLPTP